MIVRNFKLHLTKGKSVPLLIHANQYDSGEKWVFSLFNDDGTKYVPSSGAIVGIKSDNKGIINTGSIEGDDVVINETSQMTAAPGKAEFELLIDDQTHGTANFFVLVEPKPGDNADLSESDYSLFQEAIEGTSAAAIAQGVADWMDENLTPTTPVVDSSLSTPGAAADAKKTGDEINDLKSQITAIASGGTGIKDVVKQALLQLASKVAYIDGDGQDYYDALYSALYDVEVVSLTASFVQGDNLVFTLDSLDSLKQYLTVTAHYDNATSAEISAYTLSGELTDGTSVITVSYADKTTTFTVNVIEATDVTPLLSSFINTTGTIVSYDSGTNSLRVYSSSNGTYRRSKCDVELTYGKTYRMDADVQYVKGTYRLGFAAENATKKLTTAATSSGHVSFEYAPSSEDASIIDNFSIYCTWGTSQAGDITVSNFKIIEYATPSE